MASAVVDTPEETEKQQQRGFYDKLNSMEYLYRILLSSGIFFFFHLYQKKAEKLCVNYNINKNRLWISISPYANASLKKGNG